jgi:hypothetical protein
MVLQHRRRFGLGSFPFALAYLALVAGCSGGEAGSKATPAGADTSSVDIQAGDAKSADAQATPDAASPTDTGSTTSDKLKLASITPSQGKASGGESVTLTGTGFTDTTQILFGGTPIDAGNVFLLDSTTLQVKTPPHDTGLVDVSVVQPGDKPISSTLAAGFLFFNDIVVTKVEPAEGPTTGGTAITIHGTGFAGKTSVLIGGKPAIGVQVIGDDQVIAVTPPGTFGATTVHVVNERGAGLQKKGFFYTMAPSLEAVAPASGPTAGGTQAIVHGHGFTKDSQVGIGGGVAAVIEVTSESTLKIVTPSGSAGPADVSVTTKYGQGKLAGGFVYSDDKGQAATKVLSIAPAQGSLGGGNTVAIIATGLVAASDTTVLFGNKSAVVVSVSPVDHTAMVIAPKASGAGAVDVTLQTSKGTDKAVAGYKYVDVLSISDLSPPVGPSEGGTKVTIHGSGFAKGKALVQIGALPASDVTVLSDTELTAITPPGTPGYVNLLIKVGDATAFKTNAFSYAGADLQLYVPFPNTGAQAGGTFVHLYGNGFQPGMQVLFGASPATHFTFIDPTHVTCKTPPGKVGAVDVSVIQDAQKATLPSGYTYFNPMSAYGGTWGAEVDGSVNVTVLSGNDNSPVADVFTMLWTDPTTPYQGFTNADGQITFSGDNLAGKQMISVSKEGYESASVVLFDATNVTLHIHPIPPPSSGPPPPPVPQPTVSGHVIGLDKYVFVPQGNCDSVKNSAGFPVCTSCAADSDCGAGYGCTDLSGSNGKRCLKTCTASCNTGFQCQSMGKVARCVPVAGEVTSVCYHSKDSIFAKDHDPNEGGGFEASPAKDYAYKINVGYGEQAIVCFGGYKTFGAQLTAGDATSMQAFTPTMLGVKRHLMVKPALDPKTGKPLAKQENPGVDVVLEIPLSAKANLRLDKPPVWPVNAGTSIAVIGQAFLVFGGDGAIMMPNQDAKFSFQSDFDQLSIDQLPAAFSGSIHDASLSFLVFDVGVDQSGQAVLPYSITVKNDVKTLSNDAMVRKVAGGVFDTVDTGVTKTVYGMWGTSAKNLYAVGSQGSLVHWDGGGWSVQAAFAKDDLRGIYGTDASHVWTVGWNGASGFFDGIAWKKVPVQTSSSTAVNLNGIYAAGDGQGGVVAWAASQSGLYQLTSVGGVQTWTKSPSGQFQNFLAIHGVDKDHVWAVGMYGSIWAWNGQQWKAQSSGSSIALRSVWAASATSVYAVGESGQILHYDGTAWKSMPSPVKGTLMSVQGTSDSDVWASGQRGSLVHWDGKAWTKTTLTDLDKTLNAVWTSAAGDVFAMGEQELLMTPLLYPPLDEMPLQGPGGAPGILVGNTLKWKVDPSTVEPHFNYVTIGIPGMGPDTPVWNITTKGSVTEVELPDFPSIQGTPGIPKGTMLRLTILRVYKEGFDIDHYDESDINQMTWRSWAINEYFFQRQ